MCVCVCVRTHDHSCLILWDLMDCNLWGSSVHEIFQEYTGVGCHFLLQGMFLTQGWKPRLLRLLHWQVDCLPLSHLFVKVWKYSVHNSNTLSTKSPDVQLFQCSVSKPLISSTYNHASETYHITITSIYIIIYDFNDFVYRHNYVNMVTYIIIYTWNTYLHLQFCVPDLYNWLPTEYFWVPLVAQTVRICLQCGRPGFNPWVGKIPWKRERLFIPVSQPRECHGRCKKSDTTE